MKIAAVHIDTLELAMEEPFVCASSTWRPTGMGIELVGENVGVAARGAPPVRA